MPNRLAGETSPYLLQHAHNPVDWYPWGPEALAHARELDRPIFLSIGYAACHWCHVMERESFEDATTAADLNRDFVAIKVDREERPDLDQVYMGAVQAMTGQGGWPMSVFLTPDGRPFYGGTYFPPTAHHGLPAFRDVLAGAARAWREQRLEVVAAGKRLVDTLVAQSQLPTDGPAPTVELLSTTVDELQSRFDSLNGSWGGAPKFPQPMTLDFLLGRIAAGDNRPRPMVRYTLDRMADGGIHDQLGGGFHRYATDPIWLVPHFEQMLYDNAQLARTYLRAWAVLGIERYRDVAEGVLDYLIRELRRDDGTFAASQDADTDGVEGATFTWTAAEIRDVLGDDAPFFMETYGVRDEGNWEGRTILSRIEPAAGDDGIVDPDREARLADARDRLLARRVQRPQPARDDKALAAWNGLAIGALADAARLLPEPGSARYRAAATDAAAAILAGLRRSDGRLGRSWKDGRSTGEGVLEDYADLADGLLALYGATFDERWFVAASELADTILDHFVDPNGGFFDTADDHESLVTRPKDPQDNATPAGGSMATLVLLRVAALTGTNRYREAAERALATVTSFLVRYPTGFANWLSAAELAVGGIVELAIVGDPTAADTRALLAAASAGGRRDLVVAVAADPEASVVPLLADRVAINGRATAFVCRNFACRLPVTEPSALTDQLTEASAATLTEAVAVALAATVVLLRPGPDGAEVLLIHRPATMAFGPGLHVFPGGRVDPEDADGASDAVAAGSTDAVAAGAARALGGNVLPADALAVHRAAIRELREEVGVQLAGIEELVPIAHWTTPAFMSRRFSTWFFVADLPADAVPVFEPGEVAAHRWVTAGRALEQMAAGEIEMWVPTTSVLQRLIETGATRASDVAQRITLGRIVPPRILAEDPDQVRFAFGAVGGLPGRRGETTLFGGRRVVVVDPGDPSDEALGLIDTVVARREAVITAIVLTRADPDHAAAAEAIAIPLDAPILVAPGAGRHLPYATREVVDGEALPTDIEARVRLGSPGSGRLEVITG